LRLDDLALGLREAGGEPRTTSVERPNAVGDPSVR